MPMSEDDLRALIRAVRENPEAAEELRRVLLTEELLALPQVVALQGENLARLTDRVDVLTERMDVLTERMDALAERMKVLTEGMDALTERMDAVEHQISALIDTVADLAKDQGATRQMLGQFIETATGALGRIERRLDRMEGRL